MYERIPEKDTSIPFTTYGRGKNFFPLESEEKILISKNNKNMREE
jgi:hypothetical protein